MTYIVLFAGFLIQAVSGFGAGLFSVPLLTLFHEPRLIVPAFAITVWFLNLSATYETRDKINWPLVMKIAIPTWVSLPLGIYALANINQDVLRFCISLLTFIIGLLFLFRVRPPIRDRTLTYITAGLISGLLSGGAAMGGPPLIIVGYSLGWSKNHFRATLLTCFTINGAISIVLFYINGLISIANLQIVLLALPVAFTAMLIGLRIKNSLSEKLFSGIVLCLIILIGLIGIVGLFI